MHLKVKAVTLFHKILGISVEKLQKFTSETQVSFVNEAPGQSAGENLLESKRKDANYHCVLNNFSKGSIILTVNSCQNMNKRLCC